MTRNVCGCVWACTSVAVLFKKSPRPNLRLVSFFIEMHKGYAYRRLPLLYLDPRFSPLLKLPVHVYAID